MSKDSFFDTCVIIGYGLYTKRIMNIANEKCWDYINHKKGKFIVCYFVIKELSNFVKRRRIINLEVIQKKKDSNYVIGTSEIAKKELNKNEVNKAKQIYEKLKNYGIEEVSKSLTLEQTSFEIRIEQFLKFKVDDKVVLIESINQDMFSIIFELIDNYNDAKVLTSSLQEQQKRDLFLFVTIDREHFDPNSYNFIRTDPRLECYNFPKLMNLLFDK
jgi:subtilase family serine protease